MKKYIDAEALINKHAEWLAEYDSEYESVTDIKHFPAADVEEVRRGLWDKVTIEYNEAANMHIASMRCSVCKRYHSEIYTYGDPTEFLHYCNFCGAINREVKQ